MLLHLRMRNMSNASDKHKNGGEKRREKQLPIHSMSSEVPRRPQSTSNDKVYAMKTNTLQLTTMIPFI